MVGISTARDLGPLLVYGLGSETQVVTGYFVSALQEIDKIVPVFVGADDLSDLQRYAGCAILLLAGWQARTHETRILQDFRAAYPDKPIVVLGRSNDPNARMLAFVAGADNFISPDCPEAEIRAKARRILRLAQTGQASPAATGGMKTRPVKLRDLEIWPDEMVVLQNGRRVHLSQRELDMLVYLAKEHPAPVSRQTLEREVFGFRNDPGTNVVAVHVHRLRKKISPNGNLLRTTPGGYRLN